MFFVYILQSIKFKRYYIGSSDDVEKRVIEHNNGRVKSTKTYIPWKVFRTENFFTRAEARKRELQLKKWKSRSAIEKLYGKHS